MKSFCRSNLFIIHIDDRSLREIIVDLIPGGTDTWICMYVDVVGEELVAFWINFQRLSFPHKGKSAHRGKLFLVAAFHNFQVPFSGPLSGIFAHINTTHKHTREVKSVRGLFCDNNNSPLTRMKYFYGSELGEQFGKVRVMYLTLRECVLLKKYTCCII